MKNKLHLIAAFVLLLFSNDTISQIYNMTTGGTVNTCSGTFYDPGGSASNYGNNDLETMTFCSDTPGEEIMFNFSLWDLETCCDFLTIYDGPNTSSPQIYNGDGGDPSPGIVQSSSGCLTFVFDSDGSITGPGWEATISCAVPTCSDGIQNQGETGVDCGGPCAPCVNYNISTGGTVNTCFGTFFDAGGSSGNYNNNDLETMTFCSDTPGEEIMFSFYLWDLETCCDFLTIYDGPNTSSPQIYNGDGGDPSPGIIQSTNGCLTFVFDSDFSVTGPGWAATISCSVPSCSDGIQNQGETGVDCGGPCSPCPALQQDCPGAQMVCSNNSFSGNSSGPGDFDELNITNEGCLSGENQSSWYYINIGTGGTLEMSIDPVSFDDYDFAIWGPFTDITASANCPPISAPVRCSWAASTGSTGLGSGALDFSEGAGGDDWVAPLNTSPGEVYILLVDNFSATFDPFDLNWGGTSVLDCTPVTLPVDLLSFSGTKQDNHNEIKWSTSTEINNNYFILEHSCNGKNWDEIEKISGAGNSNFDIHYSTTHRDFKRAINYYRLKQVDFDGTTTTHSIISIDNGDKRVLLQRFNLMGQKVSESYKGIVIEYYDDGSTRKVMQK
jgi:hypothetical protein